MGKETFESRGLNGREALVEEIKAKAGELDDLLVKVAADENLEFPDGLVRTRIRTPNCHRMAALARTNLEQCVMWAVKAISRG